VARGQAPVFTKDVVKVNGVPVSSAPASLTNGDVVDWKMTYRFSPGQPAHARIEDVLPPTLQFVPGSWQVPPVWGQQWYDGTNWLASEPGSVKGIAAEIKFPNITPLGTGQTALIPAPPSGNINTTGSGGDGYRAIPFNGKVYMINHHNTGNYLNCILVATGAPCGSTSFHVPLSGAFSTTSTDNGTPGKPIEYLDRTTGKLYFPVENISAVPNEIGVLCADLNNQTSCGFTKIENNANGTATSSNFGSTHTRDFQGIGAVGAKLYVQLPGGRIGCVDTAPSTPALCAGQPYSLVSTTQIDYNNDSLILGTKIFNIWKALPVYRLTCFDTTTSQQCTNWTPLAPDPAGTTGVLYPLLNASGNPLGACVHTTAPTTPTVFKCYDANTAGLITPPPNYPTWVALYSGGFYQTSGYGQPAYYGTRVFNADGTNLNLTSAVQKIGCFDFGTGNNCTPNTPPFPVANTPMRHYATIADPERAGCLWYYGDDGLLGSFQAADGLPCGNGTSLNMTVTPASSYCAGGRVSAWDKLSVIGLTLAGGLTATLSIYDGLNPTQLALQANLTPYAQNLTVTSFPINLGAAGLNIGYGTLPGQYKSLRFLLQFNGVTNHAPWSQTPPPNAEVTWIGDPLEFCFRTVVAGCEDPFVTNQAKAVTTPATGSPFNNVAPNPPFKATHLTGKDCPVKLTVTKAVPGAPSGFTGTFQFHLTCSTSSGLLQQLVTITWPSTTVTIPNLQAGSTCTVSEDPALPSLPSGFSWSGLPLVAPPGGVIVLGNGTNQISFTNTVRACNDRGQVKITKVVQNPPLGFSGTFTFNIACWAGTTLTTQQVQIAYPGSTSVIVNGILLGSSCTITETQPLPTLPSGWFWDSPLYSPASGQVVLVGMCCPEIIVTNRPKFCCKEGGATGYDQH
jgi:hypothetical protein